MSYYNLNKNEKYNPTSLKTEMDFQLKMVGNSIRLKWVNNSAVFALIQLTIRCLPQDGTMYHKVNNNTARWHKVPQGGTRYRKVDNYIARWHKVPQGHIDNNTAMLFILVPQDR